MRWRLEVPGDNPYQSRFLPVEVPLFYCDEKGQPMAVIVTLEPFQSMDGRPVYAGAVELVTVRRLRGEP